MIRFCIFWQILTWGYYCGGVFNEDDNAMSNYIIAIEVFSNLGVILELNNHFQGSYGKPD